ncbi:hypothetical protein SAMN05216525_13071 [Bradyrhizobium sp. Gha]|nr:hypothetical protein SAMN05216525_13071 [Bradyrhizobium sp. Gha]
MNTKSSKREDGTCPEAIKICRSPIFGSTADRRGLFTPSALLGMPAVSGRGLRFLKDINAAAACRLVCRPMTAPLPCTGGAPAGRIAPSGAIEAKARKTIAFVAERKNETDMLENFPISLGPRRCCWAVEPSCRGAHANTTAPALRIWRCLHGPRCTIRETQALARARNIAAARRERRAEIGDS